MLALDYATRVICAMLSKWDESPRVDCFQNGTGSPADVWAQVQWGHTLVRESPSGVLQGAHPPSYWPECSGAHMLVRKREFLWSTAEIVWYYQNGSLNNHYHALHFNL